MVEAMGVNENDFSHTDSLECYACHTGWQQNCFGCHITVDDSRFARNETTGNDSRGAISAIRDDYSLDFFALGMNQRGKLSPLCSSMSLFLSYLDSSGEPVYADRVRTSQEGKLGFGWNPVNHHTVSKIPKACDTCHPVSAGENPANRDTLRVTYGFGSGEIMATDGDGVTYDLTRFLDDEGKLIADFPNPDTGPVPEDIRERALSISLPAPQLLLQQAVGLGMLFLLGCARRRKRRP
jgi:hypothetical protein